MWNKIVLFVKKVFSFFFMKRNSLPPPLPEKTLDIIQVPVIPVSEESNQIVDELLAGIGTPPSRPVQIESIEPEDEDVEELPKIDLELWVDDGRKFIFSSGYWDQIQSLGFTAAAIMVESSKLGWDSKFSYRDMAKIGKMADERGIEIILTTWPNPNPKHILDLEDEIVPMLLESGAVALEADLEFNWKKNLVVGFEDYDRAGDFLVDTFDRIQAATDVELEVTTFPYHRENLSSADVTPHVDRAIVQAYSVRNRNNKDIPWDHQYGPSKMVAHTLDRTVRVEGVKEGLVQVGVGLAAYDQTWPDHHPHEAMKLAWDSVAAYDKVVATKRRYWSSKHILGFRRKEYAFTFFQDKIYEKKTL